MMEVIAIATIAFVIFGLMMAALITSVALFWSHFARRNSEYNRSNSDLIGAALTLATALLLFALFCSIIAGLEQYGVF